MLVLFLLVDPVIAQSVAEACASFQSELNNAVLEGEPYERFLERYYPEQKESLLAVFDSSKSSGDLESMTELLNEVRRLKMIYLLSKRDENPSSWMGLTQAIMDYKIDNRVLKTFFQQITLSRMPLDEKNQVLNFLEEQLKKSTLNNQFLLPAQQARKAIESPLLRNEEVRKQQESFAFFERAKRQARLTENDRPTEDFLANNIVDQFSKVLDVHEGNFDAVLPLIHAVLGGRVELRELEIREEGRPLVPADFREINRLQKMLDWINYRTTPGAKQAGIEIRINGQRLTDEQINELKEKFYELYYKLAQVNKLFAYFDDFLHPHQLFSGSDLLREREEVIKIRQALYYNTAQALMTKTGRTVLSQQEQDSLFESFDKDMKRQYLFMKDKTKYLKRVNQAKAELNTQRRRVDLRNRVVAELLQLELTPEQKAQLVEAQELLAQTLKTAEKAIINQFGGLLERTNLNYDSFLRESRNRLLDLTSLEKLLVSACSECAVKPVEIILRNYIDTPEEAAQVQFNEENPVKLGRASAKRVLVEEIKDKLTALFGDRLPQEGEFSVSITTDLLKKIKDKENHPLFIAAINELEAAIEDETITPEEKTKRINALRDLRNYAVQQLGIPPEAVKLVPEEETKVEEKPSLEEILKAELEQKKYAKGRAGFEKRKFTERALKAPKPGKKQLPSYLEENQEFSGVSPEVASGGARLTSFEDAPDQTIDEVVYDVHEFMITTPSGDEEFKYPVSKKDEEGLERILYEQKKSDGKTVWASDNVERIYNSRFPQAFKNLKPGEKIYLHEGNEFEVAQYLKAKGFDLQTAEVYEVYTGETDYPQPHNVYIARNPETGEVRIGIMGTIGDSRRKRLESILTQSGVNAESIVRVDHNKKKGEAYKKAYLNMFNEKSPDIVMISYIDIGEIIKQYGADIEYIDLPELSTKPAVFRIRINGQVKNVMVFPVQTGELAGHLTRALTEYMNEKNKKDVQLGFVGDAGSASQMKTAFNKLNPGKETPVRKINPEDLIAPSEFVSKDGTKFTIENEINKIPSDSVGTGEGELKLVKQTVQGGAYATTEEDITWLLTYGLQIDNVDVETLHVAEEIARAQKKGLLTPRISLLLNVVDQIATGLPLSEKGHKLPGAKKQTIVRTVLKQLLGEEVENINFVKTPGTILKEQGLPEATAERLDERFWKGKGLFMTEQYLQPFEGLDFGPFADKKSEMIKLYNDLLREIKGVEEKIPKNPMDVLKQRDIPSTSFGQIAALWIQKTKERTEATTFDLEGIPLGSLSAEEVARIINDFIEVKKSELEEILTTTEELREFVELSAQELSRQEAKKTIAQKLIAFFGLEGIIEEKSFEDDIMANDNKLRYTQEEDEEGELKTIDVESIFFNARVKLSNAVNSLIARAGSIEAVLEDAVLSQELEQALNEFLTASSKKTKVTLDNIESLEELIKLLSTYSELPDEGIKTLEAMLGDGLRSQLERLKPGEALSVDAVITAIDLKLLNDKLGSHEKADLLKNAAAYQPLHRFLTDEQGFQHTGAFQKTLAAVKSEKTTQVPEQPSTVYEGPDYKVLVYEVTPSEELTKAIENELGILAKRFVEIDGERVELGDVLNAILKKYVIKIEGTPPKEVLDRITDDFYRSLTVARHYQKVISPEQKTGAFTEKEINNYIALLYNEYKTANEARKEEILDELSELLDSFSLTEDGTVLSQESLRGGLAELIIELKDLEREAQELTGKEKLIAELKLTSALIKINQLERTVRRKAVGHPKFFKEIPGKPFVKVLDFDTQRLIEMIQRYYKILIEKAMAIEVFYGASDVHDMGLGNIQSNKKDIQNFLSQELEGEELENAINELRSNIGNARDENLKTHLRFAGHPNTLNNEFFMNEQEFTPEIMNALKDFIKNNYWNSQTINTLLQNALEQNNRESSAEILVKIFSELMPGVGPGGDEVIELQQVTNSNEYAILRNYLVTLLTNREIISGTGMVKLGIKGEEARSVEEAKERSEQAALVTKAFKNIEKDYKEKLGYTYGERLGGENEKLFEEESTKILEYFEKEVNEILQEQEKGPLSSQAQKRLQKLLPQFQNRIVWAYALDNKYAEFDALRQKLESSLNKETAPKHSGLSEEQLRKDAVTEAEDAEYLITTGRAIQDISIGKVKGKDTCSA